MNIVYFVEMRTEVALNENGLSKMNFIDRVE